MRIPPELRIKKHIARGKPDECWEWTGSRHKLGYGSISNGFGSYILAHLVAYRVKNGPIPEGMFVRHTCNNFGCCNPAHLVLQTGKERSTRAAETTKLRQKVI